MTAFQQRLSLFAAVAIGLIAASVLTLRGGDAGTDADAVRGYLGPTPGPANSAQTYVDTKKRYLAELAGKGPGREAAALVSLTSYQPAPDVQARVLGVKPTVVFVRFPGSQAEPVLIETTMNGAVADAAETLRDEMEAEIRSLEQRIASAQPTARTNLQELLAQRRADVAKIRDDCGCVFAFAVEKTDVTALRELQAKKGIRLVDVPDPLVSELAGWELAPLVPPG